MEKEQQQGAKPQRRLTFVEQTAKMPIEARNNLCARIATHCRVKVDYAEQWFAGYHAPRYNLRDYITPFLNEAGIEGTFEELFPTATKRKSKK
jgi:hypothetical protein